MKRFLPLLMLLAVFVAAESVAVGCPMCKEANSAQHANIARGYFWSILFMLSMPLSILTGMSGYFYWLVRKARSEADVATEVGDDLE